VKILDAMLDGRLMYLMSAELLEEYAAVLQRPGITKHHGLKGDEIDTVLTELVANAIWREPVSNTGAPDPGDAHLWALLASHADSVLVTGDKLLLENSPDKSSVISARLFVDLFLE
jgi:predicted nucleic acid-binding protein